MMLSQSHLKELSIVMVKQKIGIYEVWLTNIRQGNNMRFHHWRETSRAGREMGGHSARAPCRHL